MSSSLTGEKALYSIYASYFYTKGQNGWAAQSDLWASQPFSFPMLHFSKSFYKNIKLLQSWLVLYEKGPAWFSSNFFHTAASVARPSNAHGSRNWMLISNFSTWFLMASILARLNRSWSSRICMLTAAWPTSFFSTTASMDWICCVLPLHLDVFSAILAQRSHDPGTLQT